MIDVSRFQTSVNQIYLILLTEIYLSFQIFRLGQTKCL